MNEHTIANVYLFMSFLLRTMVNNYTFTNWLSMLKHYKLMREYLARSLKADVNILVLLIKLASLRKLVQSRNVVCTGTSSVRMAWTLSLKYLYEKHTG